MPLLNRCFVALDCLRHGYLHALAEGAYQPTDMCRVVPHSEMFVDNGGNTFGRPYRAHKPKRFCTLGQHAVQLFPLFQR